MITVTVFDTPEGALCRAELDGRIVALSFADHWEALTAKVKLRFPHDEWSAGRGATADALDAYLAGDLAVLDDIPVDLGGTEFQAKVWAALRTIPVGETWSYRELAEAVGAPKAFRAVGTANGSNPVSVVVPCHRVVRNDGGLGGYGGGVERKAWLLRHEGARLA
jgi:O-6-methylguanine DNA methyltransferase